MLFLAVWQRNKATAIEGFWLALLLAVIVYRPFWAGMDTLTALRRTDLFTASLGSVLRLALEPGVGQPTAANVARLVSLGGFGVVVVAALVRAWQTREIVTPGLCHDAWRGVAGDHVVPGVVPGVADGARRGAAACVDATWRSRCSAWAASCSTWCSSICG